MVRGEGERDDEEMENWWGAERGVGREEGGVGRAGGREEGRGGGGGERVGGRGGGGKDHIEWSAARDQRWACLGRGETNRRWWTQQSCSWMRK